MKEGKTMVDILKEDFNDKVIVEIGTGKGNITRQLVRKLSACNNYKLALIDVCDGEFEKLKGEFAENHVNAHVLETKALDLHGMEDNSVDYVICSYSLHGSGSGHRREVLALDRFNSVLKQGGMLYIDEILCKELKPDELAAILSILGFRQIAWEIEEGMEESETPEYKLTAVK